MSNNIEQQINQAMNSLDGATKAQPAPYLLTRINARLQQKKQGAGSIWSRTVAFLNQPAVALVGVIIICLINFMAISSTGGLKRVSSSNAQNNPADFAINVGSLYDIENQEP